MGRRNPGKGDMVPPGRQQLKQSHLLPELVSLKGQGRDICNCLSEHSWNIHQKQKLTVETVPSHGL